MPRRLLFALTVMVAAAACGSPEATRSRAGGPGADVGNRTSVVKMHGGSEPFHDTPRMRGIQGPPLDGARQAERLSR